MTIDRIYCNVAVFFETARSVYQENLYEWEKSVGDAEDHKMRRPRVMICVQLPPLCKNLRKIEQRFENLQRFNPLKGWCVSSHAYDKTRSLGL